MPRRMHWEAYLLGKPWNPAPNMASERTSYSPNHNLRRSQCGGKSVDGRVSVHKSEVTLAPKRRVAPTSTLRTKDATRVDVTA